jgi:uncharacterized coiled-coil protein SlyX
LGYPKEVSGDAMSSWRRLEELEQKVPDLTIEELEEVIRFRKQHAQHLQPKVRRLAMKRVHRLESVLRQKLNQSDPESKASPSEET